MHDYQDVKLLMEARQMEAQRRADLYRHLRHGRPKEPGWLGALLDRVQCWFKNNRGQDLGRQAGAVPC